MINLKKQIIEKISTITLKSGKITETNVDILIKNDQITIIIKLSYQPQSSEMNLLKQQILANISSVPEVDLAKVNIAFTSDRVGAKEEPKRKIEGVKKVIIVAAGKGGVGKSTITALIAQSLAKENYKVGVLDADIYGPSIPQIFGVFDTAQVQDNKMIPLEKYGVKLNSIGFLIGQQGPLAWRGPMVSKAIFQLLSGTNWGELDYLLIDTPPGTGDIHLSILMNYVVDNAIIVTTPQKIAEIDVEKTINLYQKFQIPIVGIIENMAYFEDESDGKTINRKLFSGNSASDLAERYKLPILHQLAILPLLSANCDNGDELTKVARILI